MSSRHFFLTRRHWLLAVVGASGMGPGHALAQALPVPASLPEALARALQKGSPLLVMVSLDGCPFCNLVRENYLAPLQGQAGLSIVQIDMRNQQMVQDFSGARQTHDQLIRSWDIKIAPTVLFFGRGGVEVAERLVGGYIPDFYGAHLDDRLRTARAVVAH
ncbi:thioredoxin fold domain-containing protein [Rhodoferax sp.]|uniref:thioredoxin family protein n=1 Tax=Rhodoferax sp. TaxID=50421 RepID=UPI0019E492C3|nr:thioredoxin fold domain-containing protein [Rhodoferax sp.]MBE0473418.1 hypothetical protein [Rhodoferax sp.]